MSPDPVFLTIFAGDPRALNIALLMAISRYPLGEDAASTLSFTFILNLGTPVNLQSFLTSLIIFSLLIFSGILISKTSLASGGATLFATPEFMRVTHTETESVLFLDEKFASYALSLSTKSIAYCSALLPIQGMLA